MHKALRILFFFLFTLFAYVQLNDVDPWLWVSGYMLIGLTSLLSLFITPKRFVFMGLFGIYGIWTITILPEFINWLSLGMPSIVGEMKAESPYIEFAREFFGLLICGLVNFYLMKTQKSIKSV